MSYHMRKIKITFLVSVHKVSETGLSAYLSWLHICTVPYMNAFHWRGHGATLQRSKPGTVLRFRTCQTSVACS